MTDMENAFEKGKIFLNQGDIPSAVLCFESAVKQEPNNAEIWELLGTSQAGKSWLHERFPVFLKKKTHFLFQILQKMKRIRTA